MQILAAHRSRDAAWILEDSSHRTCVEGSRMFDVAFNDGSERTGH